MSKDERGANRASKDADTRLENTERWIRRVGYVVLFGASLAVFVPMVIGAIVGVNQDRVWDPFTGTPVMEELECVEEAGDLIFLAGEHSETDGMWEQRYHRWMTRCMDDHQELHDLLTITRDRMRGTEKPPKLDGVDDNKLDGPK